MYHETTHSLADIEHDCIKWYQETSGKENIYLRSDQMLATTNLPVEIREVVR
jgi:hypothetical protein